ncbi:MAG TPA: hypothetical protein VGR26_18795 [Acidimicrobiales bacterium]|nr:hypothetical protein [Acidimicrobiales bacterium]
MGAAEPRVRERERPTILVIVVPYVLATAMESNLSGRYNVVAPDLDAGETVPAMRSDAVLTIAGVPIREDIDTDLIIELPNTSFEDPVMVTVNDRTAQVHVTLEHPMHDVEALLDQHLSASP